MLDLIADAFSELFRKIEPIMRFQDITDASLAGLTVNANHIRFIFSAEIRGIHREIRNIPEGTFMLLAPLHTLCNRILMRTGKCGKYKLSAVRLPLVDLHSGHTGIKLGDFGNIAEIQPRIDSL